MLGPDRLARVVATDGLRVRSLATTDETSLRYEPLLEEGATLYLIDGPVAADGYAWYRGLPYGAGADGRPFGWVAGASRQGATWIEQRTVGCESITSTTPSFVTGEPFEQLYCAVDAGGPDITLDGTVWCSIADDHNPVNGPGWISELGYCELRAGGASRRVYGQAVHRLLNEAANPVEGQYTITGHLDDPDADACRPLVMDGDVPPDPAATILLCRTFFVVTEVRPAA